MTGRNITISLNFIKDEEWNGDQDAEESQGEVNGNNNAELENGND